MRRDLPVLLHGAAALPSHGDGAVDPYRSRQAVGTGARVSGLEPGFEDGVRYQLVSVDA